MIGERRKFAKFLSLPLEERLLFLEAFVLQVWIGLLLKIIPFRWIPRLFSNPQTAVNSQQSAPNSSSLTPHRSRLTSHISHLEQLKEATRRASRVSLWKNKCLVSSLAARQMLKRRKIQSQLSLGVAKDKGGELVAHAWLTAGNIEVVEKLGDYRELYLF